ncbi:hypothetical protein HZC31_01850 [Candidatus Woesearchaeota archaeon]|nr:hypothetical protein [Candidatus Woesearchaeota archaeon]
MYKRFLFLSCFLFLSLFFLLGCEDENAAIASCGDGICDPIEAKLDKCSLDCGTSAPSQMDTLSQKTSAGHSFVTYISSEGIGNIVVQVTLPEIPRYDEGAPLLVFVSTFFTPKEPVFDTEFIDVTKLGFAHVTYLWPGKSDPSGVSSEGIYDYGGEDSLQALRDVIHFTSGDIPDAYGNYISELSEVPLLTDNVGLYAFSHPGIAATNVLALYGDELSVAYFVGRENPTVPALSAMELGYWDGKTPVLNSLYSYPHDYSSAAISFDYSFLFWDDENHIPYFDLNGNNVPDGTDFIHGTQIPSMYGKDIYSPELLQALVDNGALSLDDWPSDLTLPSDAKELWSFRQTVHNYAKLATKIPDLKVMLVFAEQDHVQPLSDKPHIHQAYDGFTNAGLWVRLNPDISYVTSLNSALISPDNDANTEPIDWLDIEDWAHSNKNGGTAFVPLAAVAEMADRMYMSNWSENLDNVLVEYDVADLR